MTWPYTYRWQKASAAYLAAHPLCVMCLSRGVSRAAVLVDHITPHRGDMRVFWDRTNWQSLCKLDHDSTKQRIEKTGRIEGCDVDGMPLDPSHPWKKISLTP